MYLGNPVKPKMKNVLTLAAALVPALLFAFNTYAAKDKKLVAGAQAPSFSLPSAAGKTVSLEELRGKRVLLIFERFVGCAVCNLHIHQLLDRLPELRAAGYEPVVIYESDPAVLRSFAETDSIPLTMLADPQAQVYDAYGVRTSAGKAITGLLFKGDMSRARKGGKLYKGKYSHEGTKTRLVADFVIGPDGRIERAYYGGSAGDHLPLAELLTARK